MLPGRSGHSLEFLCLHVAECPWCRIAGGDQLDPSLISNTHTSCLCTITPRQILSLLLYTVTHHFPPLPFLRSVFNIRHYVHSKSTLSSFSCWSERLQSAALSLSYWPEIQGSNSPHFQHESYNLQHESMSSHVQDFSLSAICRYSFQKHDAETLAAVGVLALLVCAGLQVNLLLSHWEETAGWRDNVLIGISFISLSVPWLYWCSNTLHSLHTVSGWSCLLPKFQKGLKSLCNHILGFISI